MRISIIIIFALLCFFSFLFARLSLKRRKHKIEPEVDEETECQEEIPSAQEEDYAEEEQDFSIDNNTFQKRINQLVMDKKRRGYTITKMCKSIPVSSSTLSKWRRGEAFPNKRSVERVAAYFDVSIQWLCSPNADKEYHSLMDELKTVNRERKNGTKRK